MSEPNTALHYTANGNFANGQYAPGADGFNMADISSASLLSELPSGDKALVYLGMTGGVTAAFEAAVQRFIGKSRSMGSTSPTNRARVRRRRPISRRSPIGSMPMTPARRPSWLKKTRAGT